MVALHLRHVRAAGTQVRSLLGFAGDRHDDRDHQGITAHFDHNRVAVFVHHIGHDRDASHGRGAYFIRPDEVEYAIKRSVVQLVECCVNLCAAQILKAYAIKFLYCVPILGFFSLFLFQLGA